MMLFRDCLEDFGSCSLGWQDQVSHLLEHVTPRQQRQPHQGQRLA